MFPIIKALLLSQIKARYLIIPLAFVNSVLGKPNIGPSDATIERVREEIAVESVPGTVYVDPDPIIDCPAPHTGVHKVRTSVCRVFTDCEIGGVWYYLYTPSTCKTAQDAYLATSDPVIDCRAPYTGVHRVKRSVCDTSTDCEIDGKWYFYYTVSSCKAAQDSNDPIIDCKAPHTGIHRVKSSQCKDSTDCEIGKKWYFYLSRKKCDADQKYYWDNYYKDNYKYSPPSNDYIYTNPTPATTQPKVQDNNNAEVTAAQRQEVIDTCKANVLSYYTPLIQSCRNQYGDSSTTEACVQIYGQQRDAKLKACEQ